MAHRMILEPVGGPATEPIELPSGEEATIGRRSACNVYLTDQTVSRDHATIEWHEAAWFVKDNGSRHGTSVSGGRIEPGRAVILRHDDLLQVGRYVFRVLVDDGGVSSDTEQAQEHPPASRGTRPSIFLRLRDDRTIVRELSWTVFHRRYAPVIAGFARNLGLAAQDIDDVVQEVMLAFFRISPRFEHDPRKGRFRGYLKRITRAVLARQAHGGEGAGPDIELDAVSEEPEPPHHRDAWDRCWVEQVFQRAIDEARPRFDPRTIEAFELFGRRGVPAEEVARQLGMPVNGVHPAKGRVLRVVTAIANQIHDLED